MIQNVVWLLIAVLSLTIPLAAFARRAAISYPIVLVIAGIAIGFIPGIPTIVIDPELVLVLFLPPLLYWSSLSAPTDAMRRHDSPIAILVLGLVTFTTLVVGLVAHATIPTMTWAMAFVLGAVVAPTDELAATPVLDALRMPRALIAIVEGESLLNDATALSLYAVAAGAAVTGTFALTDAARTFVIANAGGVGFGVLWALVARELWTRIRWADLQALISVTLPFVAFASATQLGLSGVLAAVAAGVVSNRFIPRIVTPTARLQAQGFWRTGVFFVNAALFLSIGFQLHALSLRVLTQYSWQTILLDAFAVNATVVLVRVGWFIANEYVPGLPLVSGADTEPNWRRALVAAWSGFRGAVSLAAALAIPLTNASGLPLADRDLVVFLTLTVVLVTLVGGGLTLPWLIARLNIAADEDAEQADEVRAALGAMQTAADGYVSDALARGDLSAESAELLRRRSLQRLSMPDIDTDAAAFVEREHGVVAAERAALIALRNKGEIDNTVLRCLQTRLDLADAAFPTLGDFGITP